MSHTHLGQFWQKRGIILWRPSMDEFEVEEPIIGGGLLIEEDDELDEADELSEGETEEEEETDEV